MDVWTYFAQRKREFDEMSVDGRDVTFAEERGSNGQVGRMIGHVYLSEDVYLAISERVQVEGNHVWRTDYGPIRSRSRTSANSRGGKSRTSKVLRSSS